MNAIKCGLVAADFAEPDEVSDGADGAGEETLSCGDVGAGEAAAAEADHRRCTTRALSPQPVSGSEHTHTHTSHRLTGTCRHANV